MRRAGELIAAVVVAGLMCSCATAPPVSPQGPPVSPQGTASLYVDCRGARTAAPTVILEAGAFGTSADWSAVLDDLAKGGRVCAYDRAGLGRSPPSLAGKDVVAVAQELARLLDTLGETRPVILVGHSNGALYAEAFAALWPERVAGLVYVNGVEDSALDQPLAMADLVRERRASNLAGALADVGLAPLVSDVLTADMQLPPDNVAGKRAAMARRDAVIAARDEDRQIIPGLATVRRLGGSPPSIPTAVICGAADPQAPSSQAWRAAEIAPAQRARTAWVLDAPGATHTSPLVRDRAYVVAAVDWLRSSSSPSSRAAAGAGPGAKGS